MPSAAHSQSHRGRHSHICRAARFRRQQIKRSTVRMTRKTLSMFLFVPALFWVGTTAAQKPRSHGHIHLPAGLPTAASSDSGPVAGDTPTCTSRSGNRARCAIDSGYRRRHVPRLGGWETVGRLGGPRGALASRPSCVSWGPNRIDCLAIGSTTAPCITNGGTEAIGAAGSPSGVSSLPAIPPAYRGH